MQRTKACKSWSVRTQRELMLQRRSTRHRPQAQGSNKNDKRAGLREGLSQKLCGLGDAVIGDVVIGDAVIGNASFVFASAATDAAD